MRSVIKKLSLAAFFCVATAIYSGSLAGLLPLLGAGRPTATSTLDAATTAWINAVITDGGAVSATQRTRVDTLIVALKAHGLFAKMDRIWLFAGESDAHQAKIDLVNLASNTPVSAPVLGASGYAFASSAYIDTGFAAGGGALYIQNSAHFSIYIVSSRTTDQNWPHGAGNVAFNQLSLIYGKSGGSAIMAINDSNLFTGIVTANAQGYWNASRTGASAGSFRKNGGASSSAVTSTSVAIPGANFYIGAASAGGSPTALAPETIGLTTMGGGLTTTEQDNLATDLNAYMTAWGVNTY